MSTTLDLNELNVKIGRLCMLGLPGPELDEGTRQLIRDYSVGGVILFSRNIETPRQVAGLCKNLQTLALRYQGLPLFLGIDQEGGPVARLKEPFTIFPGNAAIGKSAESEKKAKQFAAITAREMRLIGLNMNLAPVLDMGGAGTAKVLAGRTFGDDPDKVARLGGIVIRTLQNKGIMAVAKHFPGLGRTALDPHQQLPSIEMEKTDLEETNLPPFLAAIESGVAGIMSSHAVYPLLDAKWPATLSKKVLTGLLRERLGYQGLVITDDMEMGAIAGTWGVVRGAVKAFAAGADILLVCKDQSFLPRIVERVRSGLLEGEIPIKRLLEANQRILRFKSKLIGQPEKISIAEVRKYFAAKKNG